MYKYARRYILCDIPKVHANYRLSLDDYLLKINENIIRTNINTSENIRNKYQKEIIVDIAMCDMILGIMKEENIVTNKKFLSIINMLNELKKMIYGWMDEKKE